MPSVELRAVEISRGPRTVLCEVDLTVPDRERIAIVGPSGCGKTSLLHAIAGLIRPSSGRILFDATDVTSRPAHRRGVSLVMQGGGLYPHLRIDAMIRMGLPRDISAKKSRKRLAEAYEWTGTTSLSKRFPHELSGGQRRRVALARLLVESRPVRLLDEPTSSLDAPVAEQMRQLIEKLHRETPATTLWVTHDEAEARQMGDRIIRIKTNDSGDGQTVEETAIESSCFGPDRKS